MSVSKSLKPFHALNFVGSNFDTFRYIVALNTHGIILIWVRQRRKWCGFKTEGHTLMYSRIWAGQSFSSLQRIEWADLLVAERFCLWVSMVIAYVDENFLLVRTRETTRWTYPGLCRILNLRILIATIALEVSILPYCSHPPPFCTICHSSWPHYSITHLLIYLIMTQRLKWYWLLQSFPVSIYVFCTSWETTADK